jgi:hypothetical protein
LPDKNLLMKLLLKIAFVFSGTVLPAQSSKSNCTSLTKADLVQKEKISDFAPAFPKGSVIKNYEIVYRTGKKPFTITGSSDTLAEEYKNTLKTVDFGSNLYVDVTYRIGPKQFSDTRCYKIIKR